MRISNIYIFFWTGKFVSCIAKIFFVADENDYMSFGVSPDIDKSIMIGSDVAVAWIDKATGKGFANDYYLEAKAQCSGNRGSCPDPKFEVVYSTCIFIRKILLPNFIYSTIRIPFVF